MIEVTLLGPWINDEDGYKKPQVHLDYAPVRYEDITGQPVENILPDPNVFVQVIWVSKAVYRDLVINPVYTILVAEEKNYG